MAESDFWKDDARGRERVDALKRGNADGTLFLETVNSRHRKTEPGAQIECGMWNSGNQESVDGEVNLERWKSGTSATSGTMSYTEATSQVERLVPRRWFDGNVRSALGHFKLKCSRLVGLSRWAAESSERISYVGGLSRICRWAQPVPPYLVSDAAVVFPKRF